MSRPQPLFGDPSVLEVTVPVATVWTSPDAPRDVDAPAVLDVPDVGAWAAAMDAPVRKELAGRTLTQLLLGEPVQVVEERGDWVRVVALMQASSHDPQGYPGWMRRAHLGSPVPRRRGAAAFVVTPSAVLSADGAPMQVSFGTGLWVDSVDEQSIRVLLPGDRTGELSLDDVRLSHKREQVFYGSDDVLDLARQFLGLRYLWGGTSSWGLDCSGLVHLTYRALGVALPRDAVDQAAAREVRPVPLDAVREGDLYFFARPDERIYHVGFASAPVAEDGTRYMLHAPEGGELIEDAPMAPHRVATLVGAGRVRKPDTGQVTRIAEPAGGDGDDA
jgi:gamma-D-glutamyl-L-lysine dipeptidyl-peptidase